MKPSIYNFLESKALEIENKTPTGPIPSSQSSGCPPQPLDIATISLRLKDQGYTTTFSSFA